MSWCARGRLITKWTVNQRPSTGLYCTPVWGPESWREAGGVNQSFVTVKTRGGFKCDFYLLPDPTDYVEVDVRYNADGTRIDV